MNNNYKSFFELVRAGLWGKDIRLSQFDDIDYAAILNIAEGQSVVGLVTAGLEQVKDSKVPQEWLLQFIGTTLQIEQRNKDMNAYLASLIDKLRKEDVYAILVKGQGIAQCYKKPLWRNSGDIDLLLSDTNYEMAKEVLLPLAIEADTEYKSLKHLGLTLEGGYAVELHGMMHSRLSGRVDRVIDEAQKDVFYGGSVRSWMYEGVTVFLPSPDNDVIFVFTHILHHYFIDGIGLKQICDWCRLLWRYRAEIDVRLLEQRLQKAGLMSEWRAFAALAVEWLGMPAEAMPLYSSDKKWSRKANTIIAFVLECGNFGHSRQVAGGKLSSAWSKMKDFVRHSRIFPLDSIKFFCHFLIDGIKLAMAK